MRKHLVLLTIAIVLLLAAFDSGSGRPRRVSRARTAAKKHSKKVAKKPVRRATVAARPVAPPVVYPTARLESEQLAGHQGVNVLQLPGNAENWVDSVFQTMTTDQKIGQFFMVAAFSNHSESHRVYIEHLIQNYHIGGVIFFQGGPHRQALLTNKYQSLSKIPLLVGIDGEWGLGMRLDSTMEFPRQMTLGAIQDNDLIYRMGLEIGRQCSRLGIHINFAPVSDINSNPQNPVIGIRSFGEGKENVASKASAYMKGLQMQHVIATAKHFPGHGDANVDSHHSLPVISRSSEQMNTIDLYPFRKLIADSLMGVVTGHLHVPVMDNQSPAVAATLSEKIVTDLLKKELGFRGLVFTDALNMGGVSRSNRAEVVNLKALIAGNDILLYPENIREATRVIREAITSGTLPQAFIDEKVKKILRAKYWSGLNEYKPIALPNLIGDLNSAEAKDLKRELCENAITLVADKAQLLPLSALDTTKLASIAIGTPAGNVFQKALAGLATMKQVASPERPQTEDDVTNLIASVGDASVVVVSFHAMSQSSFRRFSINLPSVSLIKRLQQQGKKVVAVAFGSAYSLNLLTDADALICGYQEFAETQQATAQALFGLTPANGILPVSTGDFKAGLGLNVDPTGRLVPGDPESVGMKTSELAKIDKIVELAVHDRVIPGCQVLVARKGKIIYDRNFGGLTYSSGGEKVTDNTLYDLASLTKVLGTLQAVMVLYDRKELDLTQKASVYLPELKGTNKQNMILQDLLWHQAGLISFYPTLWDRTRTTSGGLNPAYYSAQKDSAHTLQIAPTLWAKPALKDSVWKWVIQSPLSRKVDADGKPSFVYSDLSFLMLQKIVERVSKQPLDRFLEREVYQPLGMKSLTFTPLQKLTNPHCAPTEQDTYYRNQLLVGTVHDQMAAVQGGVSGHAGLFGNAHDIAKLLQMNLQRGVYGGQRIFQPQTVPYFTQTISTRSFRSLGWDKPNPQSTTSSYLSPKAPPQSFGHTGFTGNMVWVDPEQELVFIFLSNRLFPTGGNNAINTTRLRRRIQEVIYSSLKP
ncbi:glycoside hydrolase family 3 N-terminal domain-containing protein [Fibrella aquatica]|uniref:glycoside hydrolase family 3 N-terminal domain-containing protein n=1 Tax=Fibrella aquatica TaxID=3242487 RepID=UPI00351FCA69